MVVLGVVPRYLNNLGVEDLDPVASKELPNVSSQDLEASLTLEATLRCLFIPVYRGGSWHKLQNEFGRLSQFDVSLFQVA